MDKERLAMPDEIVKVQHLSLADTRSLAAIFVKSGFFQDSRDEAQAVVKILAGREMGFGPFASMAGINIIKGKVAQSANLIAAGIKRSGKYDFRVVSHNDTGCVLHFYERRDGKYENVGVSSFTQDDAKKASLGGANYQGYPRNMYFARALTNGARWYCADIFAGPVYTPDELGAPIDPETGEMVTPEPPKEEQARTFKRSMAGSRVREVIKGPSTPAETFPSEEQAEKESRELFSTPEEAQERAALNAELARLWSRLKIRPEQQEEQLRAYELPRDIVTADVAALTDYVNYLRQRAGEGKWSAA